MLNLILCAFLLLLPKSIPLMPCFLTLKKMFLLFMNKVFYLLAKKIVSSLTVTLALLTVERLKKNVPRPSNYQGVCPRAGDSDFPFNQPSKCSYRPAGGFNKSPSSSNLFHLVSLFLMLTFKLISLHLHNKNPHYFRLPPC